MCNFHTEKKKTDTTKEIRGEGEEVGVPTTRVWRSTQRSVERGRGTSSSTVV